MELTVYKHENVNPMHLSVELGRDDIEFYTEYDSESIIDEMVEKVRRSGKAEVRSLARANLKAPAVRELVEQIGAKDVSDMLIEHRFLQQGFMEAVENGDFDKAATYLKKSKASAKTVKVRRDAKEATIRAKLEEACKSCKEKAEALEEELMNNLIALVDSRFEVQRDHYADYVHRTIGNANTHFEAPNASEIAELEERIAGYKAMIKEAKKSKKALKNAEVVKFVDNDGRFNDGEIAPEVLASIKEKAQKNEFFSDEWSMF